jgi:hypothetical protein
VQHPVRKPLQAVLSAAALDGLQRCVRGVHDRREEAARQRASAAEAKAQKCETAHQSVSVTRFPMTADSAGGPSYGVLHLSEGGGVYSAPVRPTSYGTDRTCALVRDGDVAAAAVAVLSYART